MKRHRLVPLIACAALVAAPVGVAGGQSNNFDVPPECTQGGPDSTCIQDSDGQWRITPGGGLGDGGGIPSGFVALFVLVIVGGVGFSIWKVSMARRMATEAGLDPDRATAVTLLSDDGLDATYIAASIRGHQASEPSPAPPTKSAADRLRELEQLRDDGLVTAGEYDTRRRAIVEAL
jgi:hypothetical protein